MLRMLLLPLLPCDFLIFGFLLVCFPELGAHLFLVYLCHLGHRSASPVLGLHLPLQCKHLRDKQVELEDENHRQAHYQTVTGFGSTSAFSFCITF